MAKSYRPVERDQLFLMAPDMREWLPDDHLVRFVLQVIERVDTSKFHRSRARRSNTTSAAGQRGYDPDMLLGLLVYAYCVGERSSRQIERRCVTDVAFRIACAGDAPDHTVIARFRAEFVDTFCDLFAEVLTVCAAAGLVRVGSVAVDGTKIAANASIDKSKTETTLRKMAASIIEEADAVDAAEDAADQQLDGPDDRVGPGLATEAARAAAIDKALEQIEADRRDRPSKDVARTVRRVERARRGVDKLTSEVTASYERQQDMLAAGRKIPGIRAVGPERHVVLIKKREHLAVAEQALADKLAALPDKKGNLTDPESRIMKSRYGFCQAYNVHLVVSDDHMILAAGASNQPADMYLYQPMVDAAIAAVAALPPTDTGAQRRIGTVLADAGYFSYDNLTCEGPDRLIAPGSSKNIADPPPPPAKNPDKRCDRTATDAMKNKFGDENNRALYRRRGATVETINAHLKDRRGLRRFSMRGLAKVNGELNLAALATNLMRYATLTGHATV